MNRPSFFLSMLLGSALLAGCGGNERPAESGSATATPIPLSISATDLAFDQERVTVGIGQPIELTLNNQGALEHDWSVAEIAVQNVHIHSEGTSDEHAGHGAGTGQELDLHIAAPAGGEGIIEFTATAPGSYEFFCTVAGHKEAGMVGTLLVEGN